MDIRNLSRSLKAAILIHSLGKEASLGILNSLEVSEKIVVQEHLKQIGHISQDIVEKVAEEFMNDLKQGKKPNNYNKQNSAAQTKKNKEVKGKEEKNAPLRLVSLEDADPEQIVDLIKDEHPQTIAAIALHLDSNIASDVIKAFPDDLIIDVSLRMANLDKILSGIIEEVDNVFKDIMSSKQSSTVQKTSGIDQLAEILNYSDQMIAEQILSDIEKNNPELAEEIKQKMFVFEDIALIDDKGMQKILRKVETKELALALKGASDEVKQKVFKNMSKRAAEMLSEEIDTLGAVRMKDVEEAQQMINKIIQEMVASSEIVVAGRGGDQYIA
ncbi:MAG: flagellar motor switch protein FliG [Desulfobacteraceae bacterium]|nr:flagellar motor switch protein FliG [Desulfobacteraceae bacterium]MBU4053566.1 flagellar motor switch protein FliG [Pseudomonadota bacterium]